MPERAAAAAIDLLPAIDLLGGRVVRLQQGDFEQTTAFSEDPAAVAAGFIDAGASWIHVVDLDGARTGSPSHGTVIRAIIEAAGAAASIEVAGGLRSEQAVEHALTLGAARVVVGTRALADPDFAAELVRSFGPDRIAVALDVRHGSAVGQAWDPGAAGVPLDLALGRLLDAGVAWFEVTAIARDGMLSGPDLALLEQARRDPRAQIVASGGIATVGHLRAVRAIGCAGAIVGRALYDGTLRLEDALAAASE